MDKSAALIIVDMQNVFLGKAQDLVPKIQALADEWPEDNIFWLKYRNHPGSLFEKHLNWSKATVSPEIDLISGKGQKNAYTHYGYSPPEDFLNKVKSKFETAYVCGVDTDACVYACMMTLWDNGIRPILLEKYCASSGGKTFHDAALSLMHRQFGMDSVA